jgi:hypothetical protein
LTSVSQNERKAVDYLVSEIVGATSANQIAGVLLGYLEDYGGGGGGVGGLKNLQGNFGNGQTVVLAGTVAYIRIPFDITVSTWSIFSSIAGSVVVDIWRLANAEPTVANTIIGGGTKPFLSSEKLRVSSPTGWTSTALLAGDILAFRVDSCSLITKFVIQLNPS